MCLKEAFEYDLIDVVIGKVFIVLIIPLVLLFLIKGYRLSILEICGIKG